LDPPRLQNDPHRLPPFHFDADPDPDPALHFADPNPDPAFHFDVDANPDLLPKMFRIRNTGWGDNFYVRMYQQMRKIYNRVDGSPLQKQKGLKALSIEHIFLKCKFKLDLNFDAFACIKSWGTSSFFLFT
jgi:hypothetical protein